MQSPSPSSSSSSSSSLRSHRSDSTSAMTHNSDEPGPRTSSASNRSTGQSSSRRAMNPQQQLSQIEKSVTHLLVATKQLLETLTLWSRGTATESEVSDVYVRLGYEFNIATRAFNAIGVETSDLGNVPELLRSILEETLSQEASQSSLDRFLPRIRDIIINLLHGLKKKQQRLRQRSGRDSGSSNGTSSRHASLGEDDATQRQSSRPSARQGSADFTADNSEFGPRTSSIPAGRGSPGNHSLPPVPRGSRNRDTSTTDSSLSSNALQNIPVIAPYPPDDKMPSQPDNRPQQFADFPPPPPPPKQQDALAALQRGGELERRASRRFSAYQIQKHLGAANGIPMLPTQTTPVPNRGKDVRESMNAVRNRGSVAHSRKQSTQRAGFDDSAKANNLAARRISEESSATSSLVPAPGENDEGARMQSPERTRRDDVDEDTPTFNATVSGPGEDESGTSQGGDKSLFRRGTIITPTRSPSRRAKPSTPEQSQEFIPEQSPQPGKELTLFLQYKSKIKKFVLADGYNDLSMARLQLAFIEKFAWNTHNNGADLPDIYLQDPVSGVRHELEDLNDIKDRSVLVLNVEPLDEVKRHFDDGIGDLRKLVEGIKTSISDQQSVIERVSNRQQEAAKEIASLAAAPSAGSRASMLSPMPPLRGPPSGANLKGSAASLDEIQSLRRDLAVVRQTYTSFVSDVEASMTTIRSKAASVKSTAIKAEIPSVEGESGRAYVNAGKKTLNDDSEKIVNRVDDLQDLVEDLRKDVVQRGVRPIPRQLDMVAKDIQNATSEVKKLQDFLKKEKPIWTKIWEQELQMVMEDREMLTMQEELALDLQDDLEKLSETFGLVEQATKQQNLQSGGSRTTSGKGMHALQLDAAVDPHKAKDGMLNEVRALQPNHESRLEAIERAEKLRQKELESRRGGEFQQELSNFVEEGKLKKSGGFEEVERLRIAKDERIRKEVFELQAKRAAELEAKRAAAAEARRKEAEAAATSAAANPAADVDGSGDAPSGEDATEAKNEQAPATENGGEDAAT
ncbi:actin interacting protein 3-domain-containing protein [Phyllosticta citrichinensis]|uniref:Actin interacting protein 3-domain-containing protein n=1 Tax=Phyllosticta citrichinensis TaxID=1130410 RepID=A0ABR1Y5U1_9PEZI